MTIYQFCVPTRILENEILIHNCKSKLTKSSLESYHGSKVKAQEEYRFQSRKDCAIHFSMLFHSLFDDTDGISSNRRCCEDRPLELVKNKEKIAEKTIEHDWKIVLSSIQV